MLLTANGCDITYRHIEDHEDIVSHTYSSLTVLEAIYFISDKITVSLCQPS